MSSQSQYAVAPATWYERRVVLADAIVAILLILLAGTTGTVVALEVGGPLATLLPLLSSAALFVRRSRPMLMVSVTAFVAVTEVVSGLGGRGLPSDIFVLIAVHVAARYCPKWFGWSALGLGIAGSGAAAYSWIYLNDYGAGSPADRLVTSLFVFGGLSFLVIASYALGRAQLGRHSAVQRQIASLGEANRLLQIEHEQAMALAREQERAQLAAETHDILAHSLAIIVAQADGAVMLADRDATRAGAALQTIADTSREALAEVRLKVAALRAGADPHDDGLAPAKSLRDVAGLIPPVEAAGPRVRLQVSGPVEHVPAGPSLAAYRIVQESLTNILKHAGPEPQVTVDISVDESVLDVRVQDDGRGIDLQSDGNGNGLRGMRTRAEQYGGRLDAGPLVGGGFAVTAHIPIPRLTESSPT